MQTHGRRQGGHHNEATGVRHTPANSSLLLVCFALLSLAGVGAAALNPNLPPSGNFDLSHWYLTLPDSSATIVKPSVLSTGYTNAAWFYTGPEGAMTFYAPVTGGTTANSDWPRSELREMIDPADTSVNWSPYGTHVLDAQCRVTQTPSSGEIFIGQIHGYVGSAPPLMLLKFDNGVLRTQLRNSPDATNITFFTMTNVAVNDLITYQIKLVDGLLSVAVNGATQFVDVFQSDAAWKSQTFYFKAGAYCRDNTGNSSEGARLAFYQLRASHVYAPIPPAIATPPASLTTNEGASVKFRVVASGTAPLSFQWRRDGVQLPGETNSTLSFAAVQTNDTANYAVVVTNAYGSVTSAPAVLTVLGGTFMLAEGLDATNLSWATDTDAPWFWQTGLTHDGEDAAQSADIADKKTTSLQTTVTGPGTVSFWWKVSSETNKDWLLFYIGTSEQARLSGEAGWQARSFPISSGSQTLRWTYSKNGSQTGGLDRAWVDQVLFVPGNATAAPQITAQPQSRSVNAGTGVTFNVTVTGSTPLAYQWRRGGTNLANGGGASGATTAVLALTNVLPAQAGLYSVVISNAAGSVISSNAVLTVTTILDLAEALNTPGWLWITNGSAPWFAQTNVTHDGAAAGSGAIADNGSTSLQTTVTGPGTVSFWWKVSSEPGSDRLRFYTNGLEQARIFGEVDWERRTFVLSPGPQVLEWKYSKNFSTALGQDRGWVDQVEFVTNGVIGGVPRPVPAALTVSNGLAVLAWSAAPDKTYRVLFQDDLAPAAWIDLATGLFFTNAAGRLDDTTQNNAHRFYRVIEE